MNGRIWYDRRTQRYGGEIRIQDGTESIGEHATLGRAQLAWLQAMYHCNHAKPSDLGCPVPPTEGIITPNPLAAFTDDQLEAEIDRRLTARTAEVLPVVEVTLAKPKRRRDR